MAPMGRKCGEISEQASQASLETRCPCRHVLVPHAPELASAENSTLGQCALDECAWVSQAAEGTGVPVDSARVANAFELDPNMCA